MQKLYIVGCKPRISCPGVYVKGFVREEERLQLYKDASIFAMPSIYEPFGHSFLEAMAYKTPCIGSSKGAMLELIENGKTGFTAPVHDYMMLAERIGYLLEDENLRKKMGEEGRRRVETSFNWVTVAKKMTGQLENS